MQTTCGILITNGFELLICHPTNGTFWDLPKGKKDQGEEDIDAAIRELWEETSLKVQAEQLELIGTFPYKSTKELCLFWYIVTEMPDINECKCISMFDMYGKTMPEMDGYEIALYSNAIERFNPDMRRVLKPILFPNENLK